jgi:NADPH-dependent glutamate synthase beta subunit-like oxidoreductase/NAD(P)H-flavin reductase
MAGIDASTRNFPLGIQPFRYGDLYDLGKLEALSLAFDEVLAKADAGLANELAAYRGGAALKEADESDLLIRVGVHVGKFVARLFGVEKEMEAIFADSAEKEILFNFKGNFIGRRVVKRFKGEPIVADEPAYLALEQKLAANEADDELRAAKTAMAIFDVNALLERPSDAKPGQMDAAMATLEKALGKKPGDAKADVAQLLDVIERYHGARMGKVHWLSYHQPHAIDPTHLNLVPLVRPRPDLQEAVVGAYETRRARQGFVLTDPRMTRTEAVGEVHYCLYCHDRGRDSCRTGLNDKSGVAKKNPLGISLEGCPLDERISEAHWLRKGGEVIGALAMICVDNPMAPGTGHRICNDCMKACVYQKQEPVNIPQVETSILTDVLRLPFGFEIYSLLTRWNPLNKTTPHPKPYQGHNVLVVGLGPAGYTLAHYLLNEGFGVVGIDGLKIEPLPDDLTGADQWPPRAVKDYAEIEDKLDERVLMGFGGVAEYGITVRWDKNFLKVIYLTLARRDKFAIYGGVRFGGTVTIEDAWELGFHHIAIAAGAGKPTIVDMKNNLINGFRQASDFLMALQLTGASKKTSMANLQVELPAIVIGGGLTAVDTATELAAYYPVQIEKLAERVRVLGKDAVFAKVDAEEKPILERMLGHAEELAAEKQKPKPDVPALVQKWGGVSMCYRRSLTEAPAYRLNHEEVQKALEEGITIVENVTPTEAVPDQYGHVNALKFRRADKSEVTLPARSVMVAAGTSPNIIYEKERPGTFQLDEQKKFFKAHKLVGTNGSSKLVPAGKDETGFFTSYDQGGKKISYYGDNHPKYAGNVVKAMASAKHGQAEVVKLFAGHPAVGTEADWKKLKAKLDDELIATVHHVERLTPTIVEVVVKAKLQARKFEPGMFYRFQNYESHAPMVNGTKLMMEGLALTGAWVDKEAGLLSVIALEVGVSSKLCATLKKGEKVVVMGPTGWPTEIPHGEKVLLCGGGLGNAVLFSVAKALRDNGNQVVYLAGYRRGADLFKREEVEKSSDQVVWAVDAGDAIPANRPQDRSFVGNMVQLMEAYAKGDIKDPVAKFDDIDRIIAIGSDRMMSAVSRARHNSLKTYLKPEHVGIGSINSPMQCMMKEVCAQCLQRHVDPKTGQESFVFSCFNQDQELDKMDWANLAARLRQNSLLEKVTGLWFEHLMLEKPLPRL